MVTNFPHEIPPSMYLLCGKFSWSTLPGFFSLSCCPIRIPALSFCRFNDVVSISHSSTLTELVRTCQWLMLPTSPEPEPALSRLPLGYGWNGITCTFLLYLYINIDIFWQGMSWSVDSCSIVMPPAHALYALSLLSSGGRALWVSWRPWSWKRRLFSWQHQT